MPRHGISLPMNYVVIGLIVLVTAATVLLYFTGTIGTVSGIFESDLNSSAKGVARNQCLSQKPRICSQGDVTGTDWADQATYKGKACSTWQEQQHIFGAGGEEDIPTCQ